MTRFYLTRTLPLMVIGTVILILSLSPLARATEGTGTPEPSRARSVALSDATRAPSYLSYVMPRSCKSIPLHVSMSMGEVSAYRWNGSALPGQRGSLVKRWGPRVRFDGRTVCNRRGAPILFAVWTD